MENSNNVDNETSIFGHSDIVMFRDYSGEDVVCLIVGSYNSGHKLVVFVSSISREKGEILHNIKDENLTSICTTEKTINKNGRK